MQKKEMINLIRKAKDREPDAFTILMQQHTKDMYRVAIAILMNDEDAADAIQETILDCWDYSVNGKVAIKEDSNQVPQFFGVILKNGKKLSFLGDAGGSGYNDAMTKAYTIRSFVQVIEPDQVQALILQTDDAGGDRIEVPIR